MKIKCPKCKTGYNVFIKSEDISEKGKNFSCQKCDYQFLIRKKKKESFQSLMKDIKDKLNSWDESIRSSNFSIDTDIDNEENQKNGAEEKLESSEKEADALLNEILADETTNENDEKKEIIADTEEEKAPAITEIHDEKHSTPPMEQTAETVLESDSSIQDDIDSMFSEADQHDGTVKESPEASSKEESEKPAEQVAAASETASKPESSSPQDDIDKMFSEAVSEQFDGTLKESSEATGEGESEKPAEQVAAASETASESESSSPQDDIDKMFSEAVSEQLDGTLKESPEAPAKEESEKPTEQVAAAGETASESESSAQDDIDKMFSEAVSEQLDGTLKESSEATGEGEAEKPTEQVAAASETTSESESSAQDDIDKMFSEAVSEQLDGTLKESSEATGEGEAEKPTEQVAAASETTSESESSAQDDTDKMFSEAVSEQLDGTLKDGSSKTPETLDADNAVSAYQSIVDESKENSIDAEKKEADAIASTGVEEASAAEEPVSAASEKENSGEAYSIESDEFQNDLENLLKTAKKEEPVGEEKKTADVTSDTATITSDGAEENKEKLSAADTSESPDQTAPEKVVSSAQAAEATTEIESAEESVLPPEYAEENQSSEKSGIFGKILIKAQWESLKERFLFYKDLIVFFFADRKKVIKIILPASFALFLMSGSLYWFFGKAGDEITVTQLDSTNNKSKEVIAIAKAVPDSEMTKTIAGKEKKEFGQRIIPGVTLSNEDENLLSISIGSIVPVAFSAEETKIMSANIKLVIDNQKAYEQVKKGFPVYEEKVENIIEKFLEKIFYQDVHFVQEKLRKEILKRLNQEIKGGIIKTVELQDFLIQ